MPIAALGDGVDGPDIFALPLHQDLLAELANLPHRDGEVFRRPDGKPYGNSHECWTALCTAARDAIAIGFVPGDAFVDNRNNAPIISDRNHCDAAAPAEIPIPAMTR